MLHLKLHREKVLKPLLVLVGSGDWSTVSLLFISSVFIPQCFFVLVEHSTISSINVLF